MSELKVRVRARKQEAEGICSFELEPVDLDTLPAYTAGAHIDVHVGQGLVRQYSLCGDPAEKRCWRIGVLRAADSRGGSAAMHDHATEGKVLRVSPPRNLFEWVDAPHSVLVAGGIGVTPILAMAKQLHSTGHSFELHYCARSPARMAFRNELTSSGFADRVHLYWSESSTDQLDVEKVLAGVASDTHLYVCGPTGFMDHVLTSARAAGITEARLHREHFAAAVADSSADQAFQIHLQRTGVTLDVPVGISALQVLLDNGIDTNYSCEAGVCGSCLTSVLDGTPDHRDTCLMDSERATNKLFTPCCSRAKTPLLVLDL